MSRHPAIDLRPKAEPTNPVPITTADLRYVAENLLSLAAWLEAAAKEEDDLG